MKRRLHRNAPALCLICLSLVISPNIRAEDSPEGAPVPVAGDEPVTPHDEEFADAPTDDDAAAQEPPQIEDELSTKEKQPPELMADETPDPEQSAEVTDQATSVANLDDQLEIKPYDRERPNWALGFSFSRAGFGKGGDFPGASSSQTARVRGASFHFEWQPARIQSIGVLGIGLSAQLYPEYPKTDLTRNTTSFWSAGAQIRYQLKFLPGQWVVPMGGYLVERLQYKLPGDINGSLVAHGPFAGLMVLLNPLEPSVAGEAYATSGIKRTYFVAESRLRTGTAGREGPTIAETAWFWGIRSEL